MNLEGKIRNNGFYDPIRYRYWGYSKVARNHREDRPDVSQQPALPETDALLGKRTESNHFGCRLGGLALVLGHWHKGFGLRPAPVGELKILVRETEFHRIHVDGYLLSPGSSRLVAKCHKEKRRK